MNPIPKYMLLFSSGNAGVEEPFFVSLTQKINKMASCTFVQGHREHTHNLTTYFRFIRGIGYIISYTGWAKSLMTNFTIQLKIIHCQKKCKTNFIVGYTHKVFFIHSPHPVSRGEHPIEIPFLSMCEPACLY
jgi:hypothetical protein